MDKTKTSWESKKPIAFFRGLPTGKVKDGDKNVGRLKLVMDSIQRPDLVDATLTGVITGEDWITEGIPLDKF